MATKLDRKTMPAGHGPNDFEVQGRAAKGQGDFGSDVGVADCACVNQFGEANNSKYYHGSVVKSTKTGGWYVYLEWGRIFAGKSWDGRFNGQDFMMVQCDSEADARSFFAKQMASKNTKRLEEKTIAGVTVWAGKAGEDGYIVQSLATRERGLPDCYKIKDNTGVAVKAAPAAAAPKVVASTKSFQPQVVKLAQDLVGGVKTFTKAMSAASGVTPTMDTIKQVRDLLIPAALHRIKMVGDDIRLQCQDPELQAVTKNVKVLVPRPISRAGVSEEEFVLNSGNILTLQQDLDAFESSLSNEDFSTAAPASSVDPDSLLNAQLEWLDTRSGLGAQMVAALQAMTNNRHGYLRGNIQVKNLFKVTRPDRDAKFLANVQRIAALRQGKFSLRGNLQPKTRFDLTGNEGDLYGQANVILTQHATRSVNIPLITQGHFRMPKSLPGAQITGANFGHGVYHATDYKKAVGYSSYSGAVWSSGSGGVQGRGAFMFLCDMIMGDAYRAPSTGSWMSPPNGKDCVFGVGGDPGHRLENDELVIFEPFYNRIRYIVEFGF